jgi:aryl-alcohol dehydrogenase-like predicted oxidoreductase
MIGLGCMRLSTVEPRDPARAVAVIHAALDAGATLLDTADSYCLDDADTGHNERLVAQAMKTWHRDAGTITIATKGGLVRPGGRWVPDGRAKHLPSACSASLRALDVAAIDLYQLHVVDPRVPIETSIRALHSLQQEGLIRHIGLSNVTVGQIRSAQKIAVVMRAYSLLPTGHSAAAAASGRLRATLCWPRSRHGTALRRTKSRWPG